MSETAFHDDRNDSATADAQGAARDAAQTDLQAFEALTLAQLTGELFRFPGRTLRALFEVTRYRRGGISAAPSSSVSDGVDTDKTTPQLPQDMRATLLQAKRPKTDVPPNLDQAASKEVLVYFPEQVEAPTMTGQRTVMLPDSGARRLEALQWLLRAAGFAAALYGEIYMLFATRSEIVGLNVGAPWLLLGLALWAVGELIGISPALRIMQHERAERMALSGARIDIASVLWRFSLAAVGSIGALLAWRYTAGNMFTLEGVLAWLGSVLLWCWALAPLRWSPLMGLRGLVTGVRAWRPRITGAGILTALALTAIMGAAYAFRFTDFAGVPPEMTSDHVEKLLDAAGVVNGRYNVFFVNNHGRDPLQFYLLAAMHTGLDLPLDFNLLKLLTAIEGLITIPLVWVLGRVLIGRSNPHLGNLVGLAAAGLVAVSGWHVMLSRLGLRIVLTPLVTVLVLIFLARALRQNRRWDWIAVGLTLGFGVYTYQAARMLPVVVVTGVLIALIIGVWRWKAQRWIISLNMLVNLAVAGIIAFIVFVPLFRFSIEYPEDFWRRTSGRLFGDDITQDTNEAGELIFRQATLGERLEAFNENLPALMTNLRTAFLMFNWKGDVAWINNAPNYPTLDPVSSALFLVGLAAWTARMIRRRDPVDWLLMPMIFIMLLPSALAIAYPIENPSATRASGALPPVFLLAGYALAVLAQSLGQILRGRIGRGIAVIGAVALIGGSYYYGALVYFNNYYAAYRTSSLPYSDAGRVLRSFAQNNGYGNAFVIAYQYWWDHRALGIEGGRIDFPNGISSLERAPQFIADAARRPNEYQLDINRDLLFFFSPNDTAAAAWLRTMFPFGIEQTIETYHPEDIYMIYRVPPLGVDGFALFLQRNDIAPPVG